MKRALAPRTRRLTAGLVALTCGACGGEPPVPRPPPPPPAPAPVVVVAPPDYAPNLARVQSVEALDDGSTGTSGALGFLLGGRRARYVPGKPLELREDGISLRGVTRIPKALGGGFVFHADRTLLVAATFTGELRPLAQLSWSIDRVRFHPKGLFVRGEDGRALIDLKTGDRLPVRPLAAVDFALTDDGRGYALFELGEVSTTIDQGATWAPVTLSGPASELLVTKNDAWVDLALAGYAQIAPDGSARELDVRPPQPSLTRDPRWLESSSPLAVAASRGAPAGPKTLVVASRGNLYRLDSHTGAIVSVTQGAFPPDLTCELMTISAAPAQPERSDADWQPGKVDEPRSPFAPDPSDVLAVCAGSGRAAVVYGGVLGSGLPKVEKTLPSGGRFLAGDDGTLVYHVPGEAPRSTPPRPGQPAPPPPAQQAAVVFSRSPSGAWSELSLEATLASLEVEGAAKPASPAGAAPIAPSPVPPISPMLAPLVGTPQTPWKVRRVLPRAGAPLLFVLGEFDVLYLADPLTKKATPVDLKLLQAVDSQGLVRRLDPASHRDAKLIDRVASLTPDGSIVLLAPDRTFVLDEVDKGGARRATLSPHKFDAMSLAGARALARSGQRIFQTLDRGRQWREVAPPPGRSLELDGCSEVGCAVGYTVRLGWPTTSPPDPVDSPRAPAFPREVSAPLPALSCATLGVVARASALDRSDSLFLGAKPPARKPNEPDEPALPFGRRTNSSFGDAAPRGIVRGFGPFDHPQPTGAFVPDQKTDKTLTFLDFFDAAIRTVKIRSTSLVAAAAANNLGPDEALEVGAFSLVPIIASPSAKPAQAPPVKTLPVLGAYPVGEGAMFIGVRGAGDPATAFVGDVSMPLLGAVTSGTDVAALVTNGDERPTVLRFGAGTPQRLVSLPVTPVSKAIDDALGVAADGSLALLRVRNHVSPPTEADPAIVLQLTSSGLTPRTVSSGQAIALAPWSTLTPASDPACKGDATGIRVVVISSYSWVRRAESNRVLDESEGPMRALVRWSARRVCLEAIELPDLNEPAPNGIEALLDVSFVEAPAPGKPNGTLAAVGHGYESRQPIRCTLEVTGAKKGPDIAF